MDSVNLTSKRPDGSTITQNFSNINPSAAESDVALFMAHVANLSDNTLKNIEKVVAQDVDLNPRVSVQLADSVNNFQNIFEHASLKSADTPVTISNPNPDNILQTSNFADSVNNSADNVSIDVGAGADSVINSGSFVTIDAQFSSAFIDNSGSNNFYIFADSSGNSTINGLSKSDTISVTGAVDSVQSGDDLILTLPNSNVTLKNADSANIVSTPKEIFIASSSTETITVRGDGATAVKSDGTVKELAAKNGGVYGGVDAGSGADSIKVDSDAKLLSIIGGRGNDTVEFSTDTRVGGNTYIYNYGDGKDSIIGWTASDTLVVDSEFETAMSADGQHFYVKVGPGWVDFGDLKPDAKVNISISGVDNSASTLTVQRLMQGTVKSDTISNTEADAVHHGGTDSTTAWTIDAGAGNDTIFNDQNYVSIFGGLGNDSIQVLAASGTTITEGVSIYGGGGNDTIDVSADSQTKTVDGTNTTVYGAHVFEFGADDAKNTIIGYNGDDSIVFRGIDASKLSINVDTYGNYIINAENTQITLKKGTDLLGGTKLNLYNIDANGAKNAISDAVMENIATKVTASDNSVHYTLRKEILLSSSRNSENYNSNYDNYSINAAAGADYIVIDGAKNISLVPGNGNDTVVLNAASNTALIFTGNDGKTSIYGFNADSDTLVFTTSDVQISHSTIIDANSDTLSVQIVGGYSSIQLYDFDADYIRIKIADNDVQHYYLGGD